MATSATATPAHAPAHEAQDHRETGPPVAAPRTAAPPSEFAYVVVVPVTFALSIGLSIWLGLMTYAH